MTSYVRSFLGPPLLFAALADPSSVALRNAFDFGQQNSITVPLFHSFTGAFGCSTNQLRVPCGSERLRKWRAKRTLLGLHRNTLVAFSFFFSFFYGSFKGYTLWMGGDGQGLPETDQLPQHTTIAEDLPTVCDAHA
jgi:hypothetical protein